MTKAVDGMIRDGLLAVISKFTSPYMPGTSEPSRLSTCTSVSIVRAATSIDWAVRVTVAT